MARAEQPSTPARDVAAFRRGSRGGTAAVLGEDLAAFCQSGVSVIVGSCNREGQAIAGLALGARVEAEGPVRLLLERPANQALIKAVSLGAGVAATFSLPSTHRSIQLKADTASIDEPAAEDIAALDRQLAAFASQLVGTGLDAAFATTYCSYAPDAIAAIVLEPTSAFVQTPGPGAGAAIAP